MSSIVNYCFNLSVLQPEVETRFYIGVSIITAVALVALNMPGFFFAFIFAYLGTISWCKNRVISELKITFVKIEEISKKMKKGIKELTGSTLQISGPVKEYKQALNDWKAKRKINNEIKESLILRLEECQKRIDEHAVWRQCAEPFDEKFTVSSKNMHSSLNEVHIRVQEYVEKSKNFYKHHIENLTDLHQNYQEGSQMITKSLSKLQSSVQLLGQCIDKFKEQNRTLKAEMEHFKGAEIGLSRVTNLMEAMDSLNGSLSIALKKLRSIKAKSDPVVLSRILEILKQQAVVV